MNAENILDKDGFIKDGAYEIEICDSGLMLDIESASTDDGARLIAFERTSGLNQCFRIKHIEDGIYTILAVHSSKAIGIDENTKEVKTKPYDLRDDTIKWRIEDDGDNCYKIENIYCDLVLDLENEAWENYTSICVFEHHGGDNQRFRLIPKEVSADMLKDIFVSQEHPKKKHKDDIGSIFNMFGEKTPKGDFDSIMDLLKPLKKDNGNKDADALAQMQIQMQKMFESMKNQIDELKTVHEQQKAAFMADSINSSKMADEEILEMPIEDLDITVRTFNALNRADIHTVGDLINKTENDMIKIRNLSKNSLDEVVQKLALHGLSLKKENQKGNDNNLVRPELQVTIDKTQDALASLMREAVKADKHIKIFATVISVTADSSGVTTSISDLNSIDEDGLAAALEPFTNPRRIKLLKILMEEELAANELSQATGLVGGQLYHHLQNLENAGLIEKSYDKYRIVNKEILGALMVAVGNTKIAKEK